MHELLLLSLTELMERLRSRRASPVELMQAVLERIDAANPELNAFVALRDREALLADAQAAEARIARGEARPLEGVPLGVKDLEDVRGLPTSHGSRIFAGSVADRTTTQVRRLEASGAIVVGKTNTPEFGSSVCLPVPPLRHLSLHPRCIARASGRRGAQLREILTQPSSRLRA